MNRVYYGMIYAVQAVISHSGVTFSKHGQVKGYFNRNFIKTGLLPIELGRIYNKAFEYRQKFDYVDFAIPEKKLVEEYIDRASDFYLTIEAYLKSLKIK